MAVAARVTSADDDVERTSTLPPNSERDVRLPAASSGSALPDSVDQRRSVVVHVDLRVVAIFREVQRLDRDRCRFPCCRLDRSRVSARGAVVAVGARAIFGVAPMAAPAAMVMRPVVESVMA